MYWNSKIHSLVLISCHKNTSNLSTDSDVSHDASLTAPGEDFLQTSTARFLKKKSLFKNIGEFDNQCQSVHTKVRTIPKYERTVKTYHW